MLMQCAGQPQLVSQVSIHLPIRSFVENACYCLWNGIYWCWWLWLYSQQQLWVPGNGDSGSGHRPAPSCSCWGNILKSLFYSDWGREVYLSCPMHGGLLGSGGHYILPADWSRRRGSLPAGSLTRWLYTVFSLLVHPSCCQGPTALPTCLHCVQLFTWKFTKCIENARKNSIWCTNCSIFQLLYQKRALKESFFLFNCREWLLFVRSHSDRSALLWIKF